MRQAFFAELEKLMEYDPNTVLLLGEVGSFAARFIAAKFPGRVFDLGIREQTIIDCAAGMSKAGLYPFVYGIAPFFVERALEQIKVAVYNRCRFALVTVGASYDYSTEGPTHHCPGDLAILRNVPGTFLGVPGHAGEVGHFVHGAPFYQHGIAYLRLSDQSNAQAIFLHFVRQVRSDTAVVALGPILDWVLANERYDGYPVYYASVAHRVDYDLSHCQRIIVCEENYPALVDVIRGWYPDARVDSHAVRREWIKGYGQFAEMRESVMEA